MYVEINGYNGLYLIGNDGSVWNRRKQLKTFIINSGYEAIILVKDGKRKHHLIHRLIAEHFVSNPENKKEVNHINGIKLKNNACNLEWCTSSENKQHAKATGLKVYNVPTLGKKLSNKSQYHNVGYDNSRQKWNAAIRLDGKSYHQKRFDSEEEAALHVNWALDQLGLTDRPKNVIT
jgi:hypothetical protein